jgi:NapC/NirT cytochrome c family, N-terminal region
MFRRLRIAYLASNWTSLLGVVLVTTGGILWLMLLPAWWRDEMNHPYAGILANLVLPVLFFGGLALIPLGIWRHSRKRRLAGETGPLAPRGGDLRKLFIFVGLTTFVNLVIGSQFLYSAVAYMDSDAFCGKACHTVMQPEYTAYSNSPHARVGCVECHIGPGAPWFVKAKISGVRQLFAVVSHTYHRPIASPVEALRPARDTCEHCHWPGFFTGQKFFVHTEYASDEQNTPATTVASMKIGGRNWSGTVGIHGAHVNAAGHMEYVAVDHRQSIPEVTYTAPDGKVTIYKATDAPVKPEALAKGEHRVMDCMDCHNRPAHSFHLPERALDLAMAQGSISSKLPFIKKQALEALKRDYADRDTAQREIAASLDGFYKANYQAIYSQDLILIKNSIAGVQGIYERNVFPEMKITWGTYPNNLGHTDSPGCFRCHDGNHSSADGRTISNDCSTCHDLLAVGEKDPKILTDLGMNTPQTAGIAMGK